MNCNSDHLTLEPLLNAEQAADILNCSKPQVYLLARQGILPIVRIRTMVRFRMSDLELFIENHLLPENIPLNTSVINGIGLDLKSHKEGAK